MSIGVTYRMPDVSVSITRDNYADWYAIALTIPKLYEIRFEINIAHPYQGYTNLLTFREAGATVDACGWNVPRLYLAPRTDDIELVIVTCRSGNGNTWRGNVLSAANFGQWACLNEYLLFY